VVLEVDMYLDIGVFFFFFFGGGRVFLIFGIPVLALDVY